MSREPFTFTLEQGRVRPAWLDDHDEGWLAAAVDAIGSFDGRPALGARARIKEMLAPLLEANGLSPRMAAALWSIEAPRWGRAPDGRLVAPVSPSHPKELIARYNLALFADLVARAKWLTIGVPNGDPALVAAARRFGVVVRVRDTGESLTLNLSPPDLVTRDRTGYAEAFDAFVHVLPQFARWGLTARVGRGGDEGLLLVTASELRARVGLVVPPGVAKEEATRARGAEPVAKLTRSVRRGLASIASRWRVDVGFDAASLGDEIVFPDFVLVNERARVFAQAILHATGESLAASQRALDVCPVPLVFLVHPRCAAPFHAHPRRARVVELDGKSDTRALVAAAERALW